MRLQSCLTCGRISDQRYCRRHRRERRAQRQELGLTGERVMTHRDKQLREEVLSEAKRLGLGCFYCGAEAEQADHYVPITRGGARYDRANIVAACEPCNSAKGTQMPAEFLASEWLAERRMGGWSNLQSRSESAALGLPARKTALPPGFS